MNRLEVVEQILCCSACGLHKVGKGPVPFSGPTPAFLAIVGEAPGRQEDAQGAPFVGPAGQLLREVLVEAGIDPAGVFFCNAASCFPDRTPTSGEINACGTNLAAELELANPVWLCLLGGVALSTLRPDLKISRARGHVLLPPQRPYKVFVTFHPSYALRNARGEQVMRNDLHVLADMMDAERWQPMAADSCVACGVSAEDMGEHDMVLIFDEMGASYCSECYRTVSPSGKAQAKEQKKQERQQIKTGQLFT